MSFAKESDGFTMFRKLLRPREVRWGLSALEEHLSRHNELMQFEVVRNARAKIDSEWCKEGIKRGFSASQIAAIALHEATIEELTFGNRNFAYRGILTFKGREIRNAHRVATNVLVELGVFNETQAEDDLKSFAKEIEEMG